MSGVTYAAALVIGAAIAFAPPASAGDRVPDGPADWLAGAPEPGHAARAYPQFAQQQPTQPIKFMGVTTLMGRIRLGDTPFIVDVRTYPEFVAARLPNAVNVPLEEIDKRLAMFPKRGTIVLY